VKSHRTTLIQAAVVAGVTALALTSCASGGTASAPTASASASIAVDKEAASLLPASIADAGSITIGASLDYPPDNFLEDDGKTPTGYMVDMLAAVGKKLGVKIEYSRVDFASVLTGIEGGRYDAGISYLDTKQRQDVVDMVDVYGVAQSFLIMADSKWTGFPCGKKVGVGAGSTEEAILENLSKTECTDKGKQAVDILTFPSNPQSQTAMSSGRVDAVFSATAPAAWAVKDSDGNFKIGGKPFKAASGLTGIAVGRAHEGLAEALQKAVQSLIDDGTYKKILDKWDVAGLAIDASTINAATE